MRDIWDTSKRQEKSPCWKLHIQEHLPWEHRVYVSKNRPYSDNNTWHQYSLYHGLGTKFLIHSGSCNLSSNLIRQVLLVPTFYRWRNRPREVKWLAQVDLISKWKILTPNQALWVALTLLLYFMAYFNFRFGKFIFVCNSVRPVLFPYLSVFQEHPFSCMLCSDLKEARM